MKILLTAVNAKYIHSNPAVYGLRAYAGEYRSVTEIAEYTINHQLDDILADIYRREPDVAAFSCYIWNLREIKEVIRNLHRIRPELPIWVGGPEVSYDAEAFLKEMPEVTGVMTGEGEKTFRGLVKYYLEDGTLDKLKGIVYRKSGGEIRVNPPSELMNLDEIPFLYQNLEDFTNRIIYYESSRGCPFSCSYCLSSIDKSVRFRDPELVKAELQFFLDQQVPQVKFVDRTFNCNHRHAGEIWQYIQDHDNGITNFHFEIAADLLTQTELDILKQMRPGLVQLEIGVQSVNQQTIREIDRVMDLTAVAKTVAAIRGGGNIHQHLDLIAGLPGEDLDSFRHSFNEVYNMHPDQLQLGFLKVLKGSRMHRNAGSYGLVYRQEPPYEVLFTKWISYPQLQLLKAVEEMVEVYYNSGQFSQTIGRLEQEFAAPFDLFQALADYYEAQQLTGRNHARMARFEILRNFISGRGLDLAEYDELLLTDLYLRENSKSRPQWAKDQKPDKENVLAIYRREQERSGLLNHYQGYSHRQIMNMTHWEVLRRGLVIFDYRKRDRLTGNAAVYELEW